MSLPRARLGVNIDHVATVRNARGGAHPDPARAAGLAAQAGADGITMHLREDRRHIREPDLAAVRAVTSLPINFEMAATEAMLEIALSFRPHAACLVPEKREERTTEGGLDAAGLQSKLLPIVSALSRGGMRVSLFIEPAIEQIEAALALQAPVVELHTGRYVELVLAGEEDQAAFELSRLAEASREGARRGLEIHVGHGLTFDTVGALAQLPEVRELNIGHFIMGEAMFIGLDPAIRRMRLEIDRARGEAA